ncbi:MAG: hypothetical protein M3077_00860 [Candidatus Dormibacteraeota bacterium]|nr:hypothetical protein [Candidatus Dormibacteraeota bacterium]
MRGPTRLPLVPDEIIEAFRAIAPTVEAFARVNDLEIDRYRRGKAAWELSFARRIGGEATLTLSYRERTGHVLDLSAVWWVDDREAGTRRLRADKIGVFDRRASHQQLRELLDAGLARVDQWTEADLGPPHGPFGAGRTETDTAQGRAKR